MAKTTKRLRLQRTVTFTYSADMPNYSTLSDTDALAAANLPGGINSLGELLARSTAANGVVSAGAWSVSVAGENIVPYTIFAPNVNLTIGQRFSASVNPTNRLFVVTTAGTSGTSEPAWSTTVGNTTNAVGGTAVWRTIDKFELLTYAASTAYTTGKVVRPTGGDAREFLVTAGGAGTTGTPTWPTTIGASVTYGGITYLCIEA